MATSLLQPSSWEAADSSTSLSSLEEQALTNSRSEAADNVNGQEMLSAASPCSKSSDATKPPKNFILRWVTKGEIAFGSGSIQVPVQQQRDNTEDSRQDDTLPSEALSGALGVDNDCAANEDTTQVETETMEKVSPVATPSEQENASLNEETENDISDAPPRATPGTLPSAPAATAGNACELEALPFSQLEQCMDEQDEEGVCRLLELSPDLARRPVHFTLQGERTRALLLHKALHKDASLQVVDMLLTIHPQALLLQEERQGLLPLHVAVMRGASLEVVVALVRARPVALKMADANGNLPLHTAAQYSRDWGVLRFLLRACPAAATCPDTKGRVPLHLAAALGWGDETETVQRVQTLLQQQPLSTTDATDPMAALQCRDTRGNLPLHAACNQPGPVWPVIRMLMQAHPAGLLVRNAMGQLPYACLMRFSTEDESVIVAAVRDKTQEEQRKQQPPIAFKPFEKFFRRRSRKTTTTEWQPIYG